MEGGGACPDCEVEWIRFVELAFEVGSKRFGLPPEVVVAAKAGGGATNEIVPAMANSPDSAIKAARLSANSDLPRPRLKCDFVDKSFPR